MHANHVRAHAEFYIGLVEVGVGLVPAGGGCKELLLRYHAAMANPAPDRIATMFSLRTEMMAENLLAIVAQEQRRGPSLVFAHNAHLQRGRMHWQLGPHAVTWWPAGAQLGHTLGPRYAVIGTGVGSSVARGIAQPEPGTLEVCVERERRRSPEHA